MRIPLYVLFMLCITYLPAHSLLIGDDFLDEFAKRLAPEDVLRLERLKGTLVFQNLRKPDHVKMFRELEKYEILSSWAKHPRELEILLTTDVLLRAGEKRYFYLRESFREAGRSTLKKEVLLALKILIRSDFLPFLANSQFRAYLEPLLENGHLARLFGIVGDLSSIKNNVAIWSEWASVFNLNQSQKKQVEVVVPTLMRLVQDSPDEIRAKARRIRDSGYFEGETLRLWKEELYQVFLQLVTEESLAESIQTISGEDLLIPAIKRAQIDWEANLVRTIQGMPEYKDMELSSFLTSLGFKVFMNSQFTLSLLNSMRSGLLKDLPVAVGDWAILLEPRLKADYDKVMSYMEVIERERRKEKNRVEENQAKAETCSQNLQILNGKREEYNRIYREEVDLQDLTRRERFFRLIGNQKVICPDFGEYHSSEYGLVFCTVHGKTLQGSYE